MAAHAYAGRPGPVAELTERLRTLLAAPSHNPVGLPVYGTVLHAPSAWPESRPGTPLPYG
ncbi:hypothetical protein ACWDZ6_22755 [Streptomyces sp. NPDC002926]